jgi:DnaB helicase-like protein/Toprim domain-containing protein
MITSERFKDSKILAEIINKGLIWREVSKGIELQNCPFCGKENYHFFISLEGSFEGVYKCVRCGVSGNSKTLYEKLGIRIPGVESRSEWAAERKIETLPDIEEAHEALLANEKALEYLTKTRGFSLDIIKQQKLGYVEKRYFRDIGGEVPALVYPYIIGDSCSFVHYRTLPPSPKAFSSPIGREATLYNFGVLKDGIKEIILVEGEANTICLMDHGITNILGVPGANFKKALWIETLDNLNLDKIYILYDKDKTGQKAAQTLASRIGIERCWKICLPDFSVGTTGKETHLGKDINEWFTCGGTREGFGILKDSAKLFDVQGTISSKDALTELEESLEGKELLEPTYKTPWDSLNHLIGFEDGDVIDIVAPEKVGKTTFGLNLMEHVVAKYEEDGIIICLEMSTVRMARKWVSMVTGTNDALPKTREEAVERLGRLKSAIPVARSITAGRKGDLYFCYPIIKDVEDAYKLIHDCVRRYGVKWVMFDNLQLLADRTLKNQGHRTIHLSQISKTFAGIAKDYNIKFIRILQPHRIREGAIIDTDNVDGASQIAKDCDCMFALHRARIGDVTAKEFEAIGYMATEASFDSKMLVRVGLSRYSSGGIVTLEFDGATSTVREFDLAKIKEFHKEAELKGSFVIEAEARPKEILIEESVL